jgi:hypothetical protein
LIVGKTRKNVFIDSDDLKELDTLFDTVRCKLEHLVVYLTRDTLTRPWCTGEIVTAVIAPFVKITVVTTESFVAPGESQLMNLSTYIDMSGVNLSQYSISEEMIRDAYNTLLGEDTPSIEMPTGYASQRFDQLVANVLGKLTGKSAKFADEPAMQLTKRTPVPIDTFVISSDPGNDEATASASILLMGIQEHVMNRVPNGIIQLPEYDEDLDAVTKTVWEARAVAVVLSQNTLRSIQQLVVIVELMSAQEVAQDGKGPAVIPINVVGFNFPDAMYYGETLPRIWPMEPDDAEVGIKAFFKRITCFLGTHAGEDVIKTQALTIFNRIPVHEVKAKDKPVLPEPTKWAEVMSTNKSMKQAASFASAKSARTSNKSGNKPVADGKPEGAEPATYIEDDTALKVSVV